MSYRARVSGHFFLLTKVCVVVKGHSWFHGARFREALLGAGGPGEERTHGGGAGQPAVCVGRIHGEHPHHACGHLSQIHGLLQQYCHAEACTEVVLYVKEGLLILFHYRQYVTDVLIYLSLIIQ